MTPVDCFAAPAAPASPRRASSPGRARRQRRPPAAAGGSSRIDLSQAGTLAELEAMVAGFEGCALKRTAKSLCFARGRDDARIMLIGEAPGRDEDLTASPSSGAPGNCSTACSTRSGLPRSTSTSPTPSIGVRPATARRRLRRSRLARPSSRGRSSSTSPARAGAARRGSGQKHSRRRRGHHAAQGQVA